MRLVRAIPVVVVLIAMGLLACDRFQRPTEEDCELAVDHMCRLIGEEETDDLPVVPTLLCTALRHLSSDYKSAIAKCVSSSSMHEIRCVLGATTTAALKGCSTGF